jgi:hypothetical protein
LNENAGKTEHFGRVLVDLLSWKLPFEILRNMLPVMLDPTAPHQKRKHPGGNFPSPVHPLGYHPTCAACAHLYALQPLRQAIGQIGHFPLQC